MADSLDAVIQKNISLFIPRQFPVFFQLQAPVFVNFVKSYMQWCESVTPAANTTRLTPGTVSISSQMANVTANNVDLTMFNAGDQFAAWINSSSYDVFTVGNVVNTSFLSITGTLPTWSNNKTQISTVDQVANPTWTSRRVMELQDIDGTLDEYVVYFKNYLLADLNFSTNVDIRLLLKHTLDIYRSKGTEQAIKLLFQVIYGVSPKIYYPSTDLFRLSDGTWTQAAYMELSLSENNVALVGRQIFGVHSGAQAFVDRVVRKNIDGILTDCAYVSVIVGTFVTGEQVQFTGTDGLLDPLKLPTIIGSLTGVDIDINGVGAGFNIGDTVGISSGTGVGAVARVANTVAVTGTVTFDFIDGGYGYTDSNTGPILTISDNIITVNAVPSSNIWQTDYVYAGETMVQGSNSAVVVGATPTATIIENASALPAVGTRMYQFFDTNALCAQGMIQAVFSVGGSQEFSITHEYGVFRPGVNTYGEANVLIGNLASIVLELGIANATGTFNLDTNDVSFSKSGTTGSIISVSEGSGATATLLPDSQRIVKFETINVFSDSLTPYLNVAIGAATYGFPTSPTANLEATIETSMNIQSVNVGSLVTQFSTSPGSEYNFAPLVSIIGQTIYPYHYPDYIINLGNTLNQFITGELLTQETTGALAQVTGGNSFWVYARSFSINNRMTNGFTITGNVTQYSANAVTVQPNYDATPDGFNATVQTTISEEAGAITALQLKGSGFNFVDGQTVTISGTSQDGNVQSFQAFANVTTIGKSLGVYTSEGGFLSDTKKLYDGKYYQQYSYDIKSPVPQANYAPMLLSLAHPAGMAMYSTFETNSPMGVPSQILPAQVTIIVANT